MLHETVAKLHEVHRASAKLHYVSMNGLYRDHSGADLPIVFVRDATVHRGCSLGRFAPFGSRAVRALNMGK